MTRSHPAVGADSGALPLRQADCDELLRSTARLARLTSGGGAASVFLYDAREDALVLEACSGHSEDWLVGLRLPAHTGIAGWVHQTGEAVLVNSVRDDPRFDIATATSTGYVPDTIAAAPLISADKAIGVIELLDPDQSVRDSAAIIDLLGELARHCGAALLVLGEIPTSSAPRQEPSERLIAALRRCQALHNPAVSEFVTSLENLVDVLGMGGR